ncbi:MAG: hypothetical protein Athens071416_643 [Parcubacteria group bacterium Athens0714_16]|nr:MAG: hypothetical protein Athens071416_643 [Parcubacteria group bacterium Athens0714_16]
MKIKNTILKSYLTKKTLIDTEDSVNFQEIGRGAFNVNYLVKVSSGKQFLFRFILWSMRDHIKNMAEYESLTLENLESLNLSPTFIINDVSRKDFPYPLIVEKYISGKTMKQRSERYIEQILDSLPIVIKLYQKGNTNGITPQSKIISSDMFRNRLEYLTTHNSPYVELFNRHIASIDEFTRKCNEILDETVFVHGDLNPENFILSDNNKWYLVDWQSAFVGDPSFDIATLVWDFYWKFFAGEVLSEEDKNLIKQKYCELSGTSMQQLEKKIEIITIFLDLDMLLRIEYMYTRIIKNNDLLQIQDEEKDFIVQQRISPARNLLVNHESLSLILEKVKQANEEMQ